MARTKVDNKLNVVIGTKAQVVDDTTIPENSIIITTDEELTPSEIGAVEEALNDGKTYARKNKSWVEVTSGGGSGGATSIFSGTDIELDASFTIGHYLEAKPYLFELKFMNNVSDIVLTGMLKGGAFWKSTFVTFYDYDSLYLEFEVQGGMGNSSVYIRWRSDPGWNYSDEVSLEIWEI